MRASERASATMFDAGSSAARTIRASCPPSSVTSSGNAPPRLAARAGSGSAAAVRISASAAGSDALSTPSRSSDDARADSRSAGGGSRTSCATRGSTSGGVPIQAERPSGPATSSAKNAPSVLPVTRRTTSPTRKQPAHTRPALSVLAELRPVRDDRRIEVEGAALGEQVCADGRCAFRGGERKHHRVLAPWALAARVGDPTPDVEDRTPVEVDTARGAELVLVLEIRGERGGHRLPTGSDEPLTHGGSALEAENDARVHTLPWGPA